MLDVTLKVTLTINGPVLTKSTSAGSFGIDAAFAKNENGDFILPRGLIKGKLWQSFTEQDDLGIQANAGWQQLLGLPATNYLPNRGQLDFTPFVFNGSPPSTDPRYRIRMDEARGSADDGAYQVIETIAASGEQVDFSGTIRFYATDESSAQQINSILYRGLSFITNIGADKSTGFGELVKVHIESTHREMLSSPIVNRGDSSNYALHLKLRPLSPFCIARHNSKDNIFESDDIISGGVLKGCLATTWQAFWGGSGPISSETRPQIADQPEYPELCRNFEKVRFTHAFPAADGNTRPSVIPYSLVADDRGELSDVSSLVKAELGHDGKASAFQVDWKYEFWSKVRKQFGWINTKRILEVRNKHDRSRRKAEDENLFSYEMIDPEGHFWLGSVDFSRVPDSERSATVDQFKHLITCLTELRFLGKTKTRIAVETGNGLFDDRFNSHLSGESFVVSLQTPALLCDPFALSPPSGETELRLAYESVWSDISGGTLKLVNFFAGQHLAGGNYLNKRFSNSRPYNPFLLTDAGSVFVLEGTGLTHSGKSASQFIEDWHSHGLPLPPWAVDRYGPSWDVNPFIPENGYGEIDVNLDVLSKLAQGGSNV